MQGKDHSFGQTGIWKREWIKKFLEGEEGGTGRKKRILKWAVVMARMESVIIGIMNEVGL